MLVDSMVSRAPVAVLGSPSKKTACRSRCSSGSLRTREVELMMAALLNAGSLDGGWPSSWKTMDASARAPASISALPSTRNSVLQRSSCRTARKSAALTKVSSSMSSMLVVPGRTSEKRAGRISSAARHGCSGMAKASATSSSNSGVISVSCHVDPEVAVAALNASKSGIQRRFWRFRHALRVAQNAGKSNSALPSLEPRSATLMATSGVRSLSRPLAPSPTARRLLTRNVSAREASTDLVAAAVARTLFRVTTPRPSASTVSKTFFQEDEAPLHRPCFSSWSDREREALSISHAGPTSLVTR
mmetsp:Transcript_13222/g.38413  ORF Transcript_13222/g.38413 Transcript_13222/m.38413 type:complete len:303 (-) Transcript_13222:1529-2437(-)